MYLALNDRLFLAPLKNPQKVLDLATGTGIWAMRVLIYNVSLSPWLSLG